MPFRTIPDTAIQYGLISFDAQGVERTADPDGRNGQMSRRLVELAAGGAFTNIFFFSHGWRGDIPAAIDQYNRWIRAFATLTPDREQAAQHFPGFRPLYIGLHWPSEPWGDEELGGAHFGIEEGGLGAEGLFQRYLDRLGDTPAIRTALGVIIAEARRNAAADSLTDRARQAYFDLEKALALGSGDVGATPDADQDPFDPDATFENNTDEGSAFGDFSWSGFLAPLRQLSYWTMKKRARTVGESGMHAFVKELQRVTAIQGTRIHLMGHSFGCIVVSSILGGPGGQAPLERPIDSVVLVQGALSLWSYSAAIPFDGLGPGYFYRLIQDGKVQGPLVTTRSRYDRAVGEFYPWASRVVSEVAFAPGEFPKYGAIGAFGLQGLPDAMRTERPMLPAHGEYGFAKGHLYNLEASQFIFKGEGASGAHSDIDGPEVAHTLWQAAFASV
ncbi:MAG: alpha/beta hydrolase [Candidatus Competibacteraceae bacterium]